MKNTTNIFRAAFIFTMLTFANTNFVFAQKIWFIRVIQEDASTEGLGVHLDKKNMHNFIQEIARVCNFEVKEYYLKSNQITETRNAINEITPSNNDVVWFYYSGHGRNSGDGWICYPGSCDMEETKIHNKLKSKNPRLTLTMFDACNHGSTTVTTERTGELGAGIILPLMFKRTKGDIKIAGASDGLGSYGNNDLGGFLTTSFLESVKSITGINDDVKRNIWKNVLEKTKLKANAYCRQINKQEQNPKFDINVTTDIGSSGTSFAPPMIVLDQEMSLQEIVNNHITSNPGLTIEKLKEWNDGIKQYYDTSYKNNKTTYKIKSNTVPSGVLIMLEEPKPKTRNSDW